MRARARNLLLAVLMTTLIAPGNAPAADTTSAAAVDSLPAPARLDDITGLTAFIDGLLFPYMDGKIPSAVVAIVYNGRTLFAKGYGKENLARGTPVDPSLSTFRIGSTSKLLTWIAVMQLVESGKLDLDEDVNNYLHGLQLPRTYSSPITLRALLTHTAGFEEGSLLYLTGHDPHAQLSIQMTLAQHEPARIRPALTLPAYSNYGAALAGLIVEQVSGMPFNDYIRRNILDPLGMHRTTFEEPLPAQLISRQVTGYERENGEFVAMPFEIIGGFRPAGSVSATAVDMTHFMLALLQGGAYAGSRILEPETATLMQATAFQTDRRLPGMALGFIEARLNGLRIIGHPGDTDYFHTYLMLIPQKRLGLFLSYVGGESAVRRRFVRAFIDRYFPAPPAALPPIPPNFATTAQRYAGSYQPARRNVSGIYKLLNLISQTEVSVTATGRLQVRGSSPEPEQYSPIDTDLFQQVGGDRQIAFRLGSSGVASLLLIDSAPYNPQERTPWQESSSLWSVLLAFCGAVFLATPIVLLRRTCAPDRELAAQTWAIRLGVGVAVWAIASVACVIAVVVVNANVTFDGVPRSAKVVLLMPAVFVAGTLVLLEGTVRVWRGSYWTLRHRVFYTLNFAAAVIFSLFIYQWNLLGWRFG